MTRVALRSLSLFFVLLAAACQGDNQVGKPCDNAEQCGEGLICDVHDGKGTCQEAHGHDSAAETDATSEHHDSDHAASSTTHDHATTTTEATAGSTTHDHTTG